MNMTPSEQLIILGCGAAGYTAAIDTAAALVAMLITGQEQGGHNDNHCH